MKKRTVLKLVSLLSALCFMVTPVAASAEAQEQAEPVAARSVSAEPAAKRNLNVKGIYNTNVSAYRSLLVHKEGKSLGFRSILINGTYYIPIADFARSSGGMNVSYSASERTLSVSGKGLTITASDGAYVVYANDRVLFDMTPVKIMSDGKMYIPLATVLKAFGHRYTVNSWGINISGAMKPLLSASRFYDADSVLWLSRIISAESRGEPLLGQIAVGNVILNRVRSRQFPNTIWGVIFDKTYGIQFSPVENGTIYNTAAYSSVLAAKIALEGFTLSPDILYFLAPRHASSSWIVNSRLYTFTIQNHEFYA